MPACLLDTSVIIDIERGTLSWQSLQGFDVFYMAAIVLSELLVGAYHAKHEDKAAKRLAFVNDFALHCHILPFDEAVAKAHARLSALLRRSGQMIGAHDLLIAATALHYRLPLLTMNMAEFKQVPELNLIMPKG